MASTGLFGPHSLTSNGIENALNESGIGVYVLGHVNDKNAFIVNYVGRSDSDLKNRITDHVGKYRSFKYAFFKTVKNAFEKECQIYHDFPGLDNAIHPDKPTGTNYQCPVRQCRGV